MDKLALGSLFVVAGLASPLTSRVILGSATIRLEETTFASVARKLGEASIIHVGDAGGSRYQACYAASGPVPARYYLESGEMGGGDRVMQVDAVGVDVATAAEDPVIATNCRALLPGTPPLTTNRGIRLGLTRADVERRVQRRGCDSAGVTLYERSEDHGRGANASNVFSWLRVRYSNGRVAAFSTGVVSSR
jgi:hypothetical protein